MIRRTDARTGRVSYLPEPEDFSPPPSPESGGFSVPPPPEAGKHPPPRRPPPGLFERFFRSLGELEQGDLLMLLILWFLYRESGDTELLIVLAALLL